MMVPFGSLTILAVCLVIGRFCVALETTSSDAIKGHNEDNPTTTSPRFHLCVEITVPTSCSCIIHGNYSNFPPTINKGDQWETCKIIVHSITPKENDKCSINITILNWKSQHCRTIFYCPGNDEASGPEKLHSCTEVEKIKCKAPDKEICITLRPRNKCCVLVSSTDSPSTSTLTESLSIASSTPESMDDDFSGSDSFTSTSSGQASVTVTTSVAVAITAADKTSSTYGVVAGSVVIGVLLIIVIAVVLIVILFRRYKAGGRMSIDNNIETAAGERNPAYSLVQGNFSTTHDSTDRQATNVYSSAPSQKPTTPPNSNDTVLVDNELYGHQPGQNETVPRMNADASVDNSQQQPFSVYCLVQRTSTSDDAPLQPLHSAPPAQKKPSANGNDTILVENDLYGCQQAQSSTYETALRVNEENESVGNASLYTSLQLASTADDRIQTQAKTDTCSAESASAQKPPAEDSSDRLLVDNDLYNC